MVIIRPSLWFDGNLAEAMDFYTGLFPESSVSEVMRCGPAGPWAEGVPLSATFTLAGQEFNAINGGPEFAFTEAISFVLTCADQAEIDHYWAALTADGGEESMCGWCKDRFGLSWQVVPADLGRLLGSEPAMRALWQMRKIDVAALQVAALQPGPQ
jgi:predicted 3-demethylubiquinone-9 3-methyltransferase (glyoxalase superfamily)